MSMMKDLDMRILQFGLYLIDGMVETGESYMAQAERDMDEEVLKATKEMVEGYRRMNSEWFRHRVVDEDMATLFRQWLASEESAVERVIEAEHVDLEVVGYFAVESYKYMKGEVR